LHQSNPRLPDGQECSISIVQNEAERPSFAVYMKTIFARIFTEAETKAK